MKRPTFRDIDHRLKEAKEALQKGSVLFANPSKVVGEMMELEIGDSDEVWELIIKLLDEIEVNDYKGQHPPKINYEPQGTGLELWAFCWKSTLLNKTMYLKFSIKDEIFYYVSLHKSKF